MKEKTPLSHEVVCFQMLDFETSEFNSEVLKSMWKGTFILKNYFNSEGAVSYITRYQVKFYANDYYEKYQTCPMPLN